MNYDTSPVSIKKRTQRTKKRPKSSTASATESHQPKSAESDENPVVRSIETPVRRDCLSSDSPQFSEFAESPEFRVGWDDGFDTGKSACDKMKVNNLSSNKKKNQRQLHERTLRTQRILSHSRQPETVNVNDHPDSDEFLQWAESLLCASGPAKTENNGESCITLNTSTINQALSSSNVQSPNVTEMKTPKRPVYNSSPMSESSKEKSNCRRGSGTSDAFNNSSFRKLEESPLVKHPNRARNSPLFSNERNQMISPANINPVTTKDEYSDYFNDSINDLMIQCSQAVENKLNKENSDLNLLNDSSNDLILQCTQQVEENLIKQNVIDRNKHIKSLSTGLSGTNDRKKSLPTGSNLQPLKSNNNKIMSSKTSFIPKQASNLHKLDSPVNMSFDDKGPSLISTISKQFTSKGSTENLWDSPDSRNNLGGSRGGTKHFLSPSGRDEATTRKKFCHNNNIMTTHVEKISNDNQDLISILNEDEEVLSNLDIDEVLSQVPSLESITKPSTQMPKFVPETKMKRETPQVMKFNSSSNNGYATNIVSKQKIQTQPMPDVIPKYTQEQIQLKKIEAKRRQALKLRKQKSFECK